MFDKDLLNIVKPLAFLQLCLCVQKYVISDFSIKTIGKQHAVLYIIRSIILLILYILTVELLHVPYSLYITYAVITFLFVINFTILSFLNFLDRNLNARILRQLCFINRHLYDSKQSTFLEKLTWTSSIFVFMTYLLLITVKLAIDPNWSIPRGLLLFTTMVFDIELIYIMFVVCFLNCKVAKLIEIVKSESKVEVFIDESGEAVIYTKNELVVKLLFLFQFIVKCLKLTEKSSRFIVRILFCFIKLYK